MKLRDWRKAKGLTMEQAGPLLGLSQSHLSKVETGKAWPDREAMGRIFTATDGEVTPNDFVPEVVNSQVEAAE